jgi:hypothetical protein
VSTRQRPRVLLRHGELDPLDRFGPHPRRHRARAQPVAEPDQRALAVLGDAPRRRHPEAIVEDLVAQPAVVAGRLDRLHEVVHRQVALAGEVAEVPRPLQQVHVYLRCVGELHEADPVGRDRPDRIARQLARQRMPAVEDQPDRAMVGPPHDLPGVTVVADVAAPGQRLEADLDAETLRDLAERPQVVGRPVDTADRRRRDVGADEDPRGAQLAHQLELAPRPLQAARPLRFRHALEVAERLEGDYLEAVVGDHRADLCRGALVREHVRLEQLHPLEPGRGNGAQLLGQRAAERDRRDREPHASSVSARRSTASSTGRPWKIVTACSPW